ncbi:hypothetical protein ACFO9Q_20655 [Paenibacillus sp. GCM10023252]|uniref:glycan biosynthesis hexose transferase WsfD n=1 Tax=Paenibacillus sp. GCM10023252 TaxID=3252649 RepID=UPI0036078158
MNASEEIRPTQLNRILASSGRYLTPSLAAAMGVFLITVVALFMPPYIGMADNGDYFRVLYSNGLSQITPDYGSQYLGYFIKQFGILHYYNEFEDGFFSSQSLFIQLALALNKVFYSSQLFDVRFQAAILLVLHTAAVYLFVESLTWRVPRKYGYPIAALAVFIFADTAYTAYFSSFYSEGIVLIMLLFLLSAGLLIYRQRYPDWALIALFAISSLILTTSKQQNAPVGLIVAAAGVGLLFLRKAKSFRAAVATCLAAVMLAGIGTYVLIPQEFVNINKYHAMTRGVLLSAEDPEETLGQFGIDKQYAILKDTIYYAPYTTVDVNSPLLESEFYSRYGFGSILLYYAAHPGQLNDMLALAAKNAFTIRPEAMGNYEKATGRSFGEQTRFFTGYSLLKQALAPKTFGFIVIWMILIVGLYLPSFWSAFKARDARGALRLPLLLMLILIGLSGILVSIIGAGDADLAKHEFLFTAAFDLVTFVVIADLVRRKLWQNDSAVEEAGG